MIELDHVHKSFQKKQVICDLNCSIKKGCILGIIGNNGAGKTTLLRMIAGLITPDRGEIRIDGAPVRYIENRQRRRIGYMPEEAGLYRRLSVRENLRFALEFYDPGGANPNTIDHALKYLALSGREHEKTGRLSGGMRRKILFLKSCLHHPAVLLLDEPFNGIDIESRVKMRQMIMELRDNGATVCISSHATGELERICDTVLFVREGKGLYYGLISELKKDIHAPDHTSLSAVYLTIMDRL